jgi:histidinol-phosphate/aromatic aminotransferase/cobyric acid decarboxylase-like protein
MILLNQNEQEIASKIKKLKDEAGTHSPSIFTIAEKIPELNILVDACFLSNPYATELFFTYLKRDLVDSRKMRDVLEFYPSQNSVIAEILSECLNVSSKNIFIGNGAIEIIQAVIHNFTESKIIVNIPTFSSYYEFVKDGTEIIYNQLEKDENFRLNIEKYLHIVKKEKPDTIVIINPNNPDGGYVKYSDVKYLLANLTEIKTVIIDESFIHFAYEDETYEMKSATELVKDYPNLIVIKSMSKDFGIAGVRAGYAVMDSARVTYLLKNGFLWNSSGLAEYFFRLYVHNDFLKEYEKVRIQYIQETQGFFKRLSSIPQIQLYPGMANFGLVELKDGSTSTDFVSKLLISHGIYTRNCADKIGLDGQFVRIASRNKEENALIINSIEMCFE